MLSRLAQAFADGIAYQDWSDSPYRVDRAGHRREDDTKRGPQTLSVTETDRNRKNVALNVCQTLWKEDPNFDPHEFCAACGVRDAYNHDGSPSGEITYGLQNPWKDR